MLLAIRWWHMEVITWRSEGMLRHQTWQEKGGKGEKIHLGRPSRLTLTRNIAMRDTQPLWHVVLDYVRFVCLNLKQHLSGLVMTVEVTIFFKSIYIKHGDWDHTKELKSNFVKICTFTSRYPQAVKISFSDDWAVKTSNYKWTCLPGGKKGRKEGRMKLVNRNETARSQHQELAISWGHFWVVGKQGTSVENTAYR